MTRAALGALVLASAAAAGCGRAPQVERAYNGDIVRGRFVQPAAYAAFLRGAIAEAGGHLNDALVAYEQAQDLDPDSAEIAARIGAVRCRADVRDPGADRAFDRASRLDPAFARAWTERARCADARGDAAAAHRAAARAAQLDPRADAANVLVARTAARGDDAATREALVSLTATARDPAVAYGALVAWAEGHGDVALWAYALEQLVQAAPSERDAVARAAEQLAGLGETGEARAVAAAAVDVDDAPLPPRLALAARLALDEAIARGDAAALSRRATRTRLGLDEAAGRALLGARPALARSLAATQAGADPTARGARLVLAAAGGRDLTAAAAEARPGDAPVSCAALVAFGVALVHATSAPERARAALAAIAHGPMAAGDDRVVRPAVELASRGALDAGALTPDGRIELAALRGEAPASIPSGIDPRHEYLAIALSRPDGPRARELAARLAPAAVRDPVVAAAASLVLLGTGAPIARGAPRALLARDPADPLLAATALRLAEKVGDSDVARKARATLTAFDGAPRHAVE